MCQDKISLYPCGHSRSVREYCKKAKRNNIIRIGQPDTHCGTLGSRIAKPDLEESCGSACLTIPWQCSGCDPEMKQVGWRCKSCGRIRDNTCLLWNLCYCSRDHCSSLVLGNGHEICKMCLNNCVSEPRVRPAGIANLGRQRR